MQILQFRLSVGQHHGRVDYWVARSAPLDGIMINISNVAYNIQKQVAVRVATISLRELSAKQCAYLGEAKRDLEYFNIDINRE